MKLPHSWLCELSGVNWSVEEMEKRLTGSGTAGVAERIDPAHFAHVVVGRIVKLDRHPNADKLLVADVESGRGTHTVICGAPNCAVGQKVALAVPGAVLKGEFEIKEITMRGVRSAGMICAEDELGLSDDHSGIMVFDDEALLGTPVFEYLGPDDAVFSFEITPNRPDCLSAIGVAREISVLAGKEFRRPSVTLREGGAKASAYVKVAIDDADACPRYAARIIDNITIAPSPWWLRKRLRDCGVRPINNIVDITNYVMLETGHPLHAFDYHRFGSKEVVVRRGRPGEKFATLDGKEHTLDETVLLITNGKEGVAAAGVMGGLNSEVEDATRTILLEAAYFDPLAIRRSARKLGFSSESSYRFERGVDPNGVIAAADRAASLMAQLAGGEVLAGVVDTYAKKISPKTILLRLDQVERVLGADIPTSFVEKTLRGLGMDVAAGENLSVTVPTFRPDVTREIDLVEEVARIYGLDKIPNVTTNSGPLFTPIHRRETVKEDLRRIMTGLGFDETLGSGMAHQGRMEKIDGVTAPIPVSNPLSDEFTVMRTRLLYSLLLSTGNNVRHRNVDMKIFEIGRVYHRGDAWPDEPVMLGILITGKAEGAYWRRPPQSADLFDLKGALEGLAEGLGIDAPVLKPAKIPGYSSGTAFEVYIGGRRIGSMGPVDRTAARLFDVKQDCFAAEIMVGELIALGGESREFRLPPRYPASARDIAVVVDQNVPAAKIFEAITGAGGELVESVALFDLFTGEPVPAGKKSLAYSITYRSREKTLADDEVDQVHQRIVDRLQAAFGARLRE